MWYALGLLVFFVGGYLARIGVEYSMRSKYLAEHPVRKHLTRRIRELVISKGEPMKLGSKFWTVIVDAVVSLASVLATFYLVPDMATLVITLVGILQVPVIALIAAIYGENAARIKMGLLK